MKGRYSVVEVAKWFVKKEPMTHKRIQKLCYYAYAWDQAIADGDLINNCHFEAWVHGPVNPDLYRNFAGSGLSQINLDNLSFRCIKDITDPDDNDFLESVWETYKDLGANALEALTHTEMPWKKARLGCAPYERCKERIAEEDMKKYYSSIYIGEEEDSIA